MIKYCVVNKGDREVDGVLIGVFQKSMLVDPAAIFGGHRGGVVVEGPVAVVRIGNKFEEVEIDDLTLKYQEIIPLSTMKSKPDAISMGESISSGFKKGFDPKHRTPTIESGDILKNMDIYRDIDEDDKTNFEMYRESIVKGLYDKYSSDINGNSRRGFKEDVHTDQRK